jgi:hypothetical protein
LESLFIEALRKTIEHRLLDEPVVVKVNSTTIESCYDFVSEFLPLEGECPGITRSLRNLMPSLIFGFSWIYGCKTMPEKYRDEIFLCWARALAYRMVAYRQQILTEGQDGKLKRITAGLYQRLGDGPQTEIELVRRFNRLLVADCRTALQQLQAEGRVARHGDRWALASIPSPETIEIPTNNP